MSGAAFSTPTAGDAGATWLADRFLAAFGAVPGSSERDLVLMLLRRAARIRCDDAVAGAVAETVHWAPASIERNLDRMTAPVAPRWWPGGSRHHRVGLMGHDALWLEYPHPPRLAGMPAAKGIDPADLPARVGCLVFRNPGQDGHVAIFMAWEAADGRLGHSYAILHWNSDDMVAAARRVRHAAGAGAGAGAGAWAGAGAGAGVAGADAEACARLMSLATTSVPDGFCAEMEVLSPGLSRSAPAFRHALERSMQQVLGEHIFLFGLLLLIDSNVVEVAFEGEFSALHPETWRASMLPEKKVRMSPVDRLLRRCPWHGFGPSSPAAALSWRRPIRRDSAAGQAIAGAAATESSVGASAVTMD